MPAKCACTCARPPARGWRKPRQYFAEVEAEIRRLVGNDQIDVMLDNIGLPYSGINIALSDSATVGPMDGEILISLNEKHTPTAQLIAKLRRELPPRFAQLQFFFQPADIVDQVLNFGQPAPIDVRVSGPDQDEAFALASTIARATDRGAGSRGFARFPSPECAGAHGGSGPGAGHRERRDAARGRQQYAGCHEFQRADRRRISGSIRATASVIRWWCRYPPIASAPRRISQTMPVTSGSGSGQGQLLLNLAAFGREAIPMVTSQFNIRPVFDVHAERAGARSLLRRARHRCGPGGEPAGCREGFAGHSRAARSRPCERATPDLFTGIALGHRSGVPVPGHEFSELDRPVDRADGGAVCAGRRDVDAVPVANADERAGAHGHADVHRSDHRQQHSGRDVSPISAWPPETTRCGPRLPRATRGCGRC